MVTNLLCYSISMIVIQEMFVLKNKQIQIKEIANYYIYNFPKIDSLAISV